MPIASGSLPFLYTDFSGGLNTKDAPYLLTDNQARDLSNVQGTTAGAIVKRNGLVTFSTPADTLTSLFPLEDVSPIQLVGAGGTSLYAISTGGTPTVIKTGLTSGARWEFVQISAQAGAGPLWGMNGTDTPQQWNGVAGTTSSWVASSGTVPNGKYMTTAGNRVWVTGVSGFPSRVYWSDLDTNGGAASWPAANVLDLDPNDGQPITGIGHVGPYLMVTKARKLFIITNLDTGANRRLSDQVGCVAHRTIQPAPEGTYFLSEDRGVYLTNGTTLTPLSDQIQPTIDSIEAGLIGQAVAAYYKGHYYLSLPMTSSSNDTILDFDSTLSSKTAVSWWKHTFGSNQFCVWHPGGVAGLYSAKATSNIVDQAFAPNVTVDNGTPFTWVWRGPWQSPTFYRRRRYPTPYFKKRFRQVRLDGTGTVNFSVGTNFSGGEVLRMANVFMPANSIYGAADGTTFGAADGSLFGDHGSIGQVKIYSIGVYNAISMVFGATSTTSDALYSYLLVITDRRDLIVT